MEIHRQLLESHPILAKSSVSVCTKPPDLNVMYKLPQVGSNVCVFFVLLLFIQTGNKFHFMDVLTLPLSVNVLCDDIALEMINNNE